MNTSKWKVTIEPIAGKVMAKLVSGERGITRHIPLPTAPEYLITVDGNEASVKALF